MSSSPRDPGGSDKDKPDLSALPDADAIGAIAALIDRSDDEDDEGGLEHGVELCRLLRARSPVDEVVALTLYFESNAWEALRRVRRPRDGDAIWEWEQAEYEESIIALRSARAINRFGLHEHIRKAQVATNLGNALSHVGRVLEAFELWQDALKVLPGFDMALGNHARGLAYLAERTHDPGHQFVLLHRARKELRSLPTVTAPAAAAAAFSQIAERIEGHFSLARLNAALELDNHSLGTTPKEVTYRTWVLKQRLFLNPLNELGEHTIAAADPLTLPSITQPISEGPYYLGFFNQLKQEYVFARYLLFLGVTAGRHFSDREVNRLLNYRVP